MYHPAGGVHRHTVVERDVSRLQLECHLSNPSFLAQNPSLSHKIHHLVVEVTGVRQVSASSSLVAAAPCGSDSLPPVLLDGLLPALSQNGAPPTSPLNPSDFRLENAENYTVRGCVVLTPPPIGATLGCSAAPLF